MNCTHPTADDEQNREYVPIPRLLEYGDELVVSYDKTHSRGSWTLEVEVTDVVEYDTHAGYDIDVCDRDSLSRYTLSISEYGISVSTNCPNPADEQPIGANATIEFAAEPISQDDQGATPVRADGGVVAGRSSPESEIEGETETDLETTSELTGADAPAIGVDLEERTHFGHVRYAAGSQDGVIFHDPRDGRESFGLEQSEADLDAVGDEVLTAVEIRPHRPEEFGQPADRYMVTYHYVRLERRGEDREFMEPFEAIGHHKDSAVFESLEAARDALRESVVAYSSAPRRDAVRDRLEGEDDD